MGRYAALVGKRVEAHYRAGDIHLSAVGTLATDTGKAVFIEERFEQGGKNKTMRVEIPYDYVVRIVEARQEAAVPAPMPAPKKHR
jgi:hypothetical protein